MSTVYFLGVLAVKILNKNVRLAAKQSTLIAIKMKNV